MEDLMADIVADLIIELGIGDSSSDTSILERKVKNAVSEVIGKMNYPSYYTDDDKVADLTSKQAVIRNIAMYDFCQVGSEWQTSHTEASVTMAYKDRNSLFTFIPFASLN